MFPSSSSNFSLRCQWRTNAKDSSSLFGDEERKCLVYSHQVQKTNNHINLSLYLHNSIGYFLTSSTTSSPHMNRRHHKNDETDWYL
jgi:hypothetical protein